MSTWNDNEKPDVYPGQSMIKKIKDKRKDNPDSGPNGKTVLKIFGVIIAIAVGIFLLSASIAIVDAGHRGVLLHWSAVDTSHPPLDEGLHFLVPFRDTVVTIEVRTQKHVETTTAASKDLQDVQTEVTVNYHLSQESIHYLYKELGLDYERRVITPAVEETLKQVTATYNAEELITKRPLVKQDIADGIKLRLAEYNLISEVTSITNFEFSPQFREAIESKVVAEQQALKAENDLNRIKVEARQAEAHAKGIANAEIAQATGKAEAIGILESKLEQSPNYLKLFGLEKWDGVLPLVTGDGATPFIQIPLERDE